MVGVLIHAHTYIHAYNIYIIYIHTRPHRHTCFMHADIRYTCMHNDGIVVSAGIHSAEANGPVRDGVLLERSRWLHWCWHQGALLIELCFDQANC